MSRTAAPLHCLRNARNLSAQHTAGDGPVMKTVRKEMGERTLDAADAARVKEIDVPAVALGCRRPAWTSRYSRE